jgi:SAM-dependent methyltransferase
MTSTGSNGAAQRPQPHVVLDLPSRRLKSLKIERLLGLEAGSSPVRLLEIGTGSGGIAAYIGTHPSGRYRVDAVDVVDNRLVHEGYRYTPVADARLPFADGSFDVVLSNHVIEHVGDEPEQLLHLREIARVLAPGGVCYLAVPNRWMLVEPHFQVAFLSWLPVSLRSPYVRARGKGEVYDCRPLSLGHLERLLRDSGMEYRNLCVEAWRATFEIERGASVATALLRRVPDFLLRPLLPVIPTLVYRIRPHA